MFSLVPAPGHGALVQPLELVHAPEAVPKFVIGHQEKVI